MPTLLVLLPMTVLLKEKIRLNKEQYSYYFDLNYDDPCYHPNVQAARAAKNVIKYVIKGKYNGAMQDFVEWNMSAEQVVNGKTPKNSIIAKMVIEGKSLKEIHDAEPAYVGYNLQKIRYYMDWYRSQRQETKDPWQEIDLSQFELNSPNYRISKWLNDNIKKPMLPRTRHLMLVGPTLLGKSLLISKLRNYLRVYDFPIQPPYLPEWDDGNCDMVSMDDLRPGWTMSFLLNFLGGAPMWIRDYGRQVMKHINIPTIITCNRTFHQMYHHTVS